MATLGSDCRRLPASSVSSRAAAARSAAATAPTTAPSRVLTRPATGALATTRTRTTRAPPRKSCAARSGADDRARTPSTGCRQHAGGTRRRVRPVASRRGWPSAGAPRGSRTGRSCTSSARSWSRRHTRMGAMSWAVMPIRRRSQATIRALPARACHGQTRELTGRRRPTARSARPSWTSASIDHQVGGVERPVAVHERDVVRGRGDQSGVHGRAVARRRLGDDHRPEAACDGGGVVGGTVVGHDHREARGHPRQQRDEGGALVAARQDQVAGRHHHEGIRSRAPVGLPSLTVR